MIALRVYGTPAPQGSKRHVGNGVMVESSAKVKPWRQDVKYAALEARGGYAVATIITGPVHVDLVFMLPRPRSHFRTGKNAHLLRDNAPTAPHRKPDLDKLIRSTLDALGEAGVWNDDAQVVGITATKTYTFDAPGAHISITEAAA